MSGMTEKHFNDAASFLAGLRLSSDEWNTRERFPRSHGWVFRGQADAAWGLLPSGFRDPGRQMISASAKSFLRLRFDEADIESLEKRFPAAVFAIGEYTCVSEFLRRADEVRLPTPPDWVVVTDEELSAQFDSLRPLVNPGYALAQHHGVATRLLDFTSNPLVAAFFAAEDSDSRSARGDEGSGHMAVWALDGDLNRLSAMKRERRMNRLEVVEYPKSTGEFLRSQSGLFVYDGDPNEAWMRDDYCFAKLLSEDYDGRDAIRKLTLPSSCARELLEALRREGITSGSLRPSYDNVADELRSSWLAAGADDTSSQGGHS